ncbi:MAG: acetyl-CoA hydrolase/transferase family protein [Synergistales bacterium]
MGVIQEYAQKLKGPDEAVRVVKSGDWLDFGFGLSMPDILDEALSRRVPELSDLKIRGALALRPVKTVEADPGRESVCYSSWHFSGYERRLHDAGICNYIPMIYRNKPKFYRKSLEVDVAMLQVAPMDRHGWFNFSLTNSASRAICETARYVILEVNEGLPRALGGREEGIHISEVDAVVESGNRPPVEMRPAEPSELDRQIAAHIVEEIPDGATIQLGIGGLPNAVGSLVADSGIRDLGMHTEMLVDAYLVMHRKGKLTNRRKAIDRFKGTWTFCVGTRDLYDWVNENPALASYPVDYTNDPHVMAQLDSLVSINGCIEADLYGQVCSECSGIRHISGTGGQLDFVTGAYLSPGGRSFICFPSTYTDKAGQIVSRILPAMREGSVVTDPRTQTHILVTEWGKADLAGRSTWEKAERIIGISHPNFREHLVQCAEEMGIWRKTNRIP